MATRKFSDQIRRAIDRSGMSRYAICKRIGFAESSMSAFMAGKRGLSLETLDALAEVLGMEATTRKPARRAKR